MAYELRADKTGTAVATLNTQGDAVVAAIGVLRTHKMDRATLSWNDDGTFAFTKPGSKNPMLYVVKSDLRVRPKLAEPSAPTRPPGRPKKDQTDLSLKSMPPGIEVWHELKGKDVRLAPLKLDKPEWKPGQVREFGNPERYTFLFVDEAGSILKVWTTERPRKTIREDRSLWPAGATHVLHGKDVGGQFQGRWLFRKA